MKTRILIFILVLCLLLIIFSGLRISQAFNAEPTIYYDGKKNSIIFLNTNDNDIFKDLKEVMPGDRKEQEVLFKAENIKKNTKVFVNVSRNYEDGISPYIKIYKDDREILKDEEYSEIATFTNDGEIKLKVVVDVPKEAGNEIEDLKYNMEWEILVQEENEEIISIPGTYDDSNIIAYIIIIIVSLIIMIYSIRKLKMIKE